MSEANEPRTLPADRRSLNFASARYEILTAAAERWIPDAEVPDRIADMLRVARALFAHAHFVYDFFVVAVVWGTNETAGEIDEVFRRCFPDELHELSSLRRRRPCGPVRARPSGLHAHAFRRSLSLNKSAGKPTTSV